MIGADYRKLSSHKLQANIDRIPRAWRLSSKHLEQIHAESDLSVLDIPQKCGILSEREIDITENHDATALIAKLATKQFSSVEVVTAFCKRAAVAHQLVNCLTEIIFEDAMERAKACDAYLASTGRVIGPLHGLPVSVKDSFNVAGYQAIMGFASFASRPVAKTNSAVVDILIHAGAVIHAKTNVPQTMMCCDSINNIFGRTINPHKLSLTAGGSTGGEGALLAMRGSPLGVGTDMGGSVRIPALCNGVIGFKPSASRLPFAGEALCGRSGNPKKILACVGPMGHSPRDMELFLRVMIDAEPWNFDETTIPVPWRRIEARRRPLRLGMILEDKDRILHPPMLRTMMSAQKAIAAAGHEIIPLADKIPSLWEASSLAWKYFKLDTEDTYASYIQEAQEPLIESLKSCRHPENDDWEPSLDNLWTMNAERGRILKIYHDIIVEYQLDGFLMPPYQSTAQPHDLYGVPMYTVLANLLDYPAVALPYLRADETLDERYQRQNLKYEPFCELFRATCESVAELIDTNTDRAASIEGAPSAIQLMGRPMKDEELVDIAASIYQALNVSM